MSRKCTLNINEISQIIAKYEMLSSLRTSSNDNYPAERYMKSLEGDEKKVLHVYIEAKFRETINLIHPLLTEEKKPEA